MPPDVWLPEVPGDPAGMRALAASLRGDADRIGGFASTTGTAVDAMTFEGPAATRIRGRVRGARRSLASAADALTAIAGTLERSASEVEQAQADRLRKMADMRRDAMTALARAQ